MKKNGIANRVFSLILSINLLLGSHAGYSKGLKISCCKKAEEAIDSIGKKTSDGISHLGDEAKNLSEKAKSEVANLERDISLLKKTLSTDYLERKVREIKAPKIPDISQAKDLKIKWPNTSEIFKGIDVDFGFVDPATASYIIGAVVVALIALFGGGVNGSGSEKKDICDLTESDAKLIDCEKLLIMQKSEYRNAINSDFQSSFQSWVENQSEILPVKGN